VIITNSSAQLQSEDTTSAGIIDTVLVDSTENIIEPVAYKIGDIADGGKAIPVHLIK
jgi:hypothetical protein